MNYKFWCVDCNKDLKHRVNMTKPGTNRHYKKRNTEINKKTIFRRKELFCDDSRTHLTSWLISVI